MGVSRRPYCAALIVPTGIGCAIGGYAGDALPVARALAAAVDCLITHPNVLNGAQLYWPDPKIFYVEGYALDQFAAGHWSLQPVHRNRIGLVLDQGIEADLRLRQLQSVDAARATLGLEIADYVVTDQPLGVTLKRSTTGASWGTIERPDSLLRAVDTLIQQAGAEAIAIVARFPDDPESEALQQYRQGQGVDALAGAEAVISHLVVQRFQIPCAHAPALQPLPLDSQLSPRAAAEELGYTFLPCVLVGLSQAPRYGSATANAGIKADQVDALVVPASACGGSAVLSWGDRPTRIIAVEDNRTTLDVPPEPLGLQVLRVRSYWEAIGVIVSDRAGVNPMALSTHAIQSRPLSCSSPPPPIL